MVCKINYHKASSGWNDTLKQQAGKLRIIGGKWRGRNLLVADRKVLRPTPNRVRETLFNWLRTDIVGAKCLDLFAGSGVLGIEAVSRGAASSTLIEQDSEIVETLRRSLDILDAKEVVIHQAEALQWIKNLNESFGIIFLDPPFGLGLVEQSVSLLLSSGHITDQTLIYVESENGWQPMIGLEVVKQAKAGQVNYALFKVAVD